MTPAGTESSQELETDLLVMSGQLYMIDFYSAVKNNEIMKSEGNGWKQKVS